MANLNRNFSEKQKLSIFLEYGIKIKKSSLDTFIKELYEFTKLKYKEDLSEFNILDLIDPGKGRQIVSIYLKYYIPVKEQYNNITLSKSLICSGETISDSFIKNNIKEISEVLKKYIEEDSLTEKEVGKIEDSIVLNIMQEIKSLELHNLNSLIRYSGRYLIHFTNKGHVRNTAENRNLKYIFNLISKRYKRNVSIQERAKAFKVIKNCFEIDNFMSEEKGKKEFIELIKRYEEKIVMSTDKEIENILKLIEEN